MIRRLRSRNRIPVDLCYWNTYKIGTRKNAFLRMIYYDWNVGNIYGINNLRTDNMDHGEFRIITENKNPILYNNTWKLSQLKFLEIYANPHWNLYNLSYGEWEDISDDVSDDDF
jgi:hypothetical protein